VIGEQQQSMIYFHGHPTHGGASSTDSAAVARLGARPVVGISDAASPRFVDESQARHVADAVRARPAARAYRHEAMWSNVPSA